MSNSSPNSFISNYERIDWMNASQTAITINKNQPKSVPINFFLLYFCIIFIWITLWNELIQKKYLDFTIKGGFYERINTHTYSMNVWKHRSNHGNHPISSSIMEYFQRFDRKISINFKVKCKKYKKCLWLGENPEKISSTTKMESQLAFFI